MQGENPRSRNPGRTVLSAGRNGEAPEMGTDSPAVQDRVAEVLQDLEGHSVQGGNIPRSVSRV